MKYFLVFELACGADDSSKMLNSNEFRLQIFQSQKIIRVKFPQMFWIVKFTMTLTNEMLNIIDINFFYYISRERFWLHNKKNFQNMFELSS